jgi:hypothetical protein
MFLFLVGKIARFKIAQKRLATNPFVDGGAQAEAAGERPTPGSQI